MVTRRDIIKLTTAGLAGTVLESQGVITRSALAIRGAMMSGGKKLPYDAEVEWLGEGPIGSYIDTLIPVDKSLSCRVDMEVVNATKMDGGGIACVVYGLGTSWSFNSYGLFYLTQQGQGQRGKLNFHGNNFVLSGVIQTDDPVDFHVEIDANGSNSVALRCGSFSGTASIANVTSSRNFWILWNRSNNSEAKQRLKAISFIKNGTVVADYIPVRVGPRESCVGYLYDRVNPTGGPLGNGLYGNSGTGAFVIGPDK